jgi:hypothetical protein
MFFPQQPPFVAKNFFTVVALLNPTSVSCKFHSLTHSLIRFVYIYYSKFEFYLSYDWLMMSIGSNQCCISIDNNGLATTSNSCWFSLYQNQTNWQYLFILNPFCCCCCLKFFTFTSFSDPTPEQQREYDLSFNITAKYWKFLQDNIKLSVMNYFQQV